MPRVPTLYRFIKWHYLETRKMGFQISEDAARREALDIWATMTILDKARVKYRVLGFEVEILPPEALVYYDEIARSSGSMLKAIAEDAVLYAASEIMVSPKKAIHFIYVRESPEYLSYPEELTLVKFSLARGVEKFFHAMFYDQALGKTPKEFGMMTNRTGLSSTVVPLRDDLEAGQNLIDLATAIRKFTSGEKLFTKRSQMHSCHNVIQLVNRVDVFFKNSIHEIFSAERLLGIVAGEKVSQKEIHCVFERIETSPGTGIPCMLHQACGQAEKCTLYNALNLAERFGEIYARLYNINTACFSLKKKMGMTLFSTSFKKRKPAKTSGNKIHVDSRRLVHKEKTS